MAEKASWGYLPQEIRLRILEDLLHDGCSLAGLATVSREWQETIERHNFARIRLTPSRLPFFGSMTHRNRALVRHIWLCLEAVKYDCPFTNPQGIILWGNEYMDTIVMFTALVDLFSALSTWEPQGDLVLDLGYHSPSDSEYWFKELTFVPDIPSAEECDRALCATAKEKRAIIEGDKEHGWTGAPPFIAIATAFPQILLAKVLGVVRELQLKFWEKLPTAPAVTGLLLRQQNRRRWNPYTVASMIRRLPGLREIHYEPWREWNYYYKVHMDGVQQAIFSCPTIAKLERLVVFENFDQRFLPRLLHYEPLKMANPVVSQCVARASLGLKHLSAAFIVDARDFFVAGLTWPNLTTLALTSRLLAPDAKQEGVDTMLKAAAAAAARMPNLETMEIWNGQEGLAGMFRYRSARGGRTAGITWRGTWDLGLGRARDVIQAWEDVANADRRAGLVVGKWEVVDAGKIRFHGDAIHHLGLEAQVMRPVSLYQMRMERDVREVTA